MAKHRGSRPPYNNPRYNQKGFPNLDAMSQRELDAYAHNARAAAKRYSGATRDWLTLAGNYARYKSKAMGFRLSGDIGKASNYERLCEDIYRQLPARMKW